MKPEHIKREGAPSQEELQTLLSLIGEFRASKPYETIDSSEYFGIKQEDGSIVWCIIMGQAGIELGLSLFYGNRSFESFMELLEDPQHPDCYPFRYLDGVYFNLVNKKELEDEDLANLSALNFKTYGRGNGWPLIRRYIPGHITSEMISKRDCDAMTQLLRLLPQIEKDYRAGNMKWVDSIDELYPVLSVTDDGIEWDSLSPEVPLEDIRISLDEFTEAKLPKCKAVGNSLFVGSPMLFMPIEDTNPPTLPEASVIMDASSGMVLDFSFIEEKSDLHESRAKNVAAFLLKEGVRPAEIVFDCDVLADYFGKIYHNTDTTIDCYPSPDFYLDMLDEMVMMSSGI